MAPDSDRRPASADARDEPSTWIDGPWLDAGLHAVPLVGVLILGWSLFSVMLVYWMEMGLIIVGAMARICWCGGTPVSNTIAMALLSPIYFGPALGFVFAFFMAVVTFFHGPDVITASEDLPSLAEIRDRIVAEWLWVPTLVLVLGQLREFAFGWVASGAFRTASMLWEMLRLYGTVITMMAVLLLAAALLLNTGLGSLAVAAVVLVRIGLALAFHFVPRAFGGAGWWEGARRFLR